MTKAQALRVQQNWSELAGESIKIEEIGSRIYAFGTELGILRIEHKMRAGRANYSENLKSWYYTTEGV